MVFDEQLLLADLGLSTTAHPGLVLATRLLRFETVAMTTGANLVFDRALADMVARSFAGLAGRAKDLGLRESSFLARFMLQIGMVEPDEARIMLADMAAARLPADDRVRQAYALARASKTNEL